MSIEVPPCNNRLKRTRLICGRWADIVLLSVLAALCTVYIEPVIRKFALGMQEIGRDWNDWLILSVYLIIPLALAYSLKAIGGFRIRDLDFVYSFSNPPTWYAGMFGLCAYPVVSFLLSNSPYLGHPLFYWSGIFFLALLVISTTTGVVWRLILRLIGFYRIPDAKALPSNLRNQEEKDRFAGNVDRFIEWLKEEKPIENIEDDFFDAQVIARRILAALPIKSISLIGPYGSGKTSILNLARSKLKKEKNKITISISAWGYENKKLVTYILENVINEVAKYTDCLCIFFLPLNFQNIFLNNSWGIFDLLKFIFAFENPECLISRLNDILRRANKTLIIFLEDIDRNQDTNVHHQLYSLFNYFTDADHISFVVTYGAEEVVEPLTKITDKTDIVPKLDESILYDWLTQFRSHCLERYGDIAPPEFDRKAMDEHFGLYNLSSDRHYELRAAIARMRDETKSYKPVDCVIQLLRYPRQFKRTLAGTWEAWQKIHGEVYFDDLLVIHTIKTSCCELFHYIINNRDQLKSFGDVNTKVDNKQLYQHVESILGKSDVLESARMLHQALIQFFFPGWRIQTQTGTERIASASTTLHPQGVASDSAIDYFARAFAEEVGEKGVADQTVLCSLLDYDNGKVSSEEIMTKALDSSGYAERIEHFAKILKPARVLELTSEYFRKMFQTQPRTRFGDHRLAGRLWRMSLDNYETEENHAHWCETEIEKYLSSSIRFANDIFYFWRHRTRSDAGLKHTSARILRTYIDKIQRLSANSAHFVSVLNHDKPFIWTLRHIVFGFFGNEEVRVAEDEFFSRWQPWLANSLLQASEQAQGTVAMYAVPLLYESISTVQDLSKDTDDDTEDVIRRAWSAKLDEIVAKKLFGDDLPKIMKVVSSLREEDYRGYSGLDEQAKSLLEYAIAHSKQWLVDNQVP